MAKIYLKRVESDGTCCSKEGDKFCYGFNKSCEKLFGTNDTEHCNGIIYIEVKRPD